MVYANKIQGWVREVREFTVTDEHLWLLRHAHVSWNPSEHGSPEIDCKRPYGESYVARSVAEILGAPQEVWVDGERGGLVVDEAVERLHQLHVETTVALQIALGTGEFRAGRYRRRGEYQPYDWVRVGD
jgi:hypothetical protein